LIDHSPIFMELKAIPKWSTPLTRHPSPFPPFYKLYICKLKTLNLWDKLKCLGEGNDSFERKKLYIILSTTIYHKHHFHWSLFIITRTNIVVCIIIYINIVICIITYTNIINCIIICIIVNFSSIYNSLLTKKFP
jgi:hypothetical protein